VLKHRVLWARKQSLWEGRQRVLSKGLCNTWPELSPWLLAPYRLLGGESQAQDDFFSACHHQNSQFPARSACSVNPVGAAADAPASASRHVVGLRAAPGWGDLAQGPKGGDSPLLSHAQPSGRFLGESSQPGRLYQPPQLLKLALAVTLPYRVLTGSVAKGVLLQR